MARHKYAEARRKWQHEVRPRFARDAADPDANPVLWAAYGKLIEAVDEILPGFEGSYLIPADFMEAIDRALFKRSAL